MVGCEGVRFKQNAVEFLNEKEKLPIDIHRRMQAVYGAKCVVAQFDVGYESLSKKWGKQVCVT